MKSVGDTLRQARLDQGLEIAEIATRLKINPKYLHAIERNELSDLPGVFFYRSFVQQYTRALNLDGTEIENELNRILGARPEPPLPGQDGAPVPARRPSYGSGGRLNRNSLAGSVARLAIVLIGCSGVYAAWINREQVRSAATAVVDRLTTKQVEPLPLPPPTTPRAPELVGHNPAAPPLSAVPEPGPSAGHLLLRLTATEATWVSIVADGKTVYVGVLQPSETRSIDGKFAKLTTGNAGGLSVEYNGKSIGSVGDRGQVRVVTFSPDHVEFTPPTPAAAPVPPARTL